MKPTNTLPLTFGLCALLFSWLALLALSPSSAQRKPEASKAKEAATPKEVLQDVLLACACIPADMRQLKANQPVNVAVGSMLKQGGATGQATLTRTANATKIEFETRGLTQELFVYTVSNNRVTLLGKLTPQDGAAKTAFQTMAQEFQLVLSPNAKLKK